MIIEKRPAGRTSLRLSTFGLGTATLGGNFRPPIDGAAARSIVERALEIGISYVDTAPFYGYGKAERVVGDVLRQHEGWTLSTKVGRLLKPRTNPRDANDQWVDPLPFEQVYDYSYDGVMRSFEDSLQRLGLDHIDILLMHDISTETLGPERKAELFPIAMDGGYKALDRLRSSGAIKAIGLGVNEWQALAEATEYGQWDCFLLAGRYTLLEQEPLHTLFPLCEKAGTSIIVGGPFNSGILAGRDTWNYARAPQAVIDRVKAIARVCDAHGVPLPAAALAFPLANPLVASVIPGPRAASELDEIMGWWTTDIPGSLWSDLKNEGLIDAAAPVPA
ncbi:aldo/keto reductase [Kaistia dalseonensis]|uniref:D-threo-aldose 1-dehydrogenase n=1 Tax=Kaistia dalseonensis TaxID=410840 RepID=A0ABU0H6A8_9HYPH|nr:aldo/keto reductase [Kaistia dalseonensis]MCX5495256.1 aldo/keto reductase [Kaistia dalseonensis]MDQ0437842.1 D-threo-aldose 1-dehydrogenase [Kaistia dalseonensis]